MWRDGPAGCARGPRPTGWLTAGSYSLRAGRTWVATSRLAHAREHLPEQRGEVALLLRGAQRGHERELQLGALAHEFGGADAGAFGLGLEGRPQFGWHALSSGLHEI